VDVRLTVQKQPGLRPTPFSLTVALPPGAAIESLSGGASASNNGVTFATNLDRDVSLEVTYVLP